MLFWGCLACKLRNLWMIYGATLPPQAPHRQKRAPRKTTSVVARRTVCSSSIVKFCEAEQITSPAFRTFSPPRCLPHKVLIQVRCGTKLLGVGGRESMAIAALLRGGLQDLGTTCTMCHQAFLEGIRKTASTARISKLVQNLKRPQLNFRASLFRFTLKHVPPQNLPPHTQEVLRI